MGIYATNSRYDTILLHRQSQRDAADLREARSAARQTAAQNTMAKSDTLRNTLATSISNSGADQSNLLANVIRTRMADEAKAKTESNKWYL
jgi:hypothetical protein